MRLDPIELRDYDPAWAASFDIQRRELERVLDGRLVSPFQHIGSTSIPALSAKPIIDMLAVVDDHRTLASALDDLQAIPWFHAPEPGDEDQRKWSLCHPTIQHRTHHLHVVEETSSGWQDWLLFRDYLRSHPTDADRYSALKQRLAAEDQTDRPRYRAGKAPHITTGLENFADYLVADEVVM